MGEEIQIRRAARSDVAYIQRNKSRVVHANHFSFRFVVRGPGHAITCSISKKVARGAVQRNKIKRWCREAIRQNYSLLKKPTTGIMQTRTTLGLSFKGAREEIRDIFMKVQKQMTE